MQKNKYLTSSLLAVSVAAAMSFSISTHAQPQVSTLLSNGQNYDGIYVTKSGRILISHPDSDQIFEIINGQTELLSNGNGQFSYVVDINEDEAGNLLLTEYDRNLLLTMDAEGTLSQVASVPGGNDIVLDSNAAMYVADSKTDKVHQVLADGTVTEIVGLSDPVGLAIDENNNLFASVSSGTIYRIDVNTKTAAELATVPSQIWHLESMGSTHLVAAGYSSHNIYAVAIETGEVCVVAGTGSAGQADGEANQASFTNPLDLAFDGTDQLHITSAGSVRTVLFPQDSSICADETTTPPPPPPPPVDNSGGAFGLLLAMFGLLGLTRLRRSS